MKTCGNEQGNPVCCYAMFAPVNLCLAPYAVDDPKRKRTIDSNTECFSPKWFLQTDSGKRRNELELYKIVQSQKKI